MFDTLLSSVQILLSVLGFAGGVDLASLGGMTGALALTVAVLAAAAVLLTVVAMTHPAAGGASPPHPLRAIDISSPLLQSDPDAPGHPRPRAPQVAASAA
ncbi:DUF6412 domain-containing protein [Microbacterium sp. NPDC055910]|uniref:DUF6412 domain-containing protein n=1 Tax=Microbacterium sp. NPDC055910 TaxID=3345659 RepID=UPI0035DFC3E7